jgi:Nitrile hydratase beta subunit, C-terminal
VTFAPGQAVRVAPRRHDGHHRTPWYVKGKTGTVERTHGHFTDPETRAYGSDGMPGRALYLVSFDQAALWPDYSGRTHDRLLVDVFEHWLEPA